MIFVGGGGAKRPLCPRFATDNEPGAMNLALYIVIILIRAVLIKRKIVLSMVNSTLFSLLFMIALSNESKRGAC